MAKAETDGVIDIDGVPRRIKAGQEIPEGATVRKTETPSMARERQPVETREPKDTGAPAEARSPTRNGRCPRRPRTEGNRGDQETRHGGMGARTARRAGSDAAADESAGHRPGGDCRAVRAAGTAETTEDSR